MQQQTDQQAEVVRDATIPEEARGHLEAGEFWENESRPHAWLHLRARMAPPACIVDSLRRLTAVAQSLKT